MKYHKDCGGEIRRRSCLRCGEHWGRTRWMMRIGIIEKGDGPDKPEKPKPGKFDSEEYKKRIREGRDIYR